MSIPSTEMADVMRRLFEAQLRDVHTAMPAQVLDYDSVKQTVDVQPMIKELIQDPDGTKAVFSYPRIYSVPVVFPRNSNFFLSFPIDEGDFVLLLFTEWSVNRFMELGREEDPLDPERHGFSGAVAIPGLYPEPLPLAEADAEKMVLGLDGGTQLRIAPDGQVEISSLGGVTQYVALADKVKAQLDKVVQDLTDLRAALSSWVPVPNDGGLALKTALAAAPLYRPWLPSGSPTIEAVASTVVKAEE